MKTQAVVIRILEKISAWVNWVLSLFLAKDVFYLVVTMLFLFGVGMAFSDKAIVSGKLGDAFCILFDPGRASGSKWTMLLFFLVWMVGGGVLVSVMVAQYNKNAGGYFRRWSSLVRNHVVVLGWDDGMLEKLKSLYSEMECYVITSRDISSLKKSFKNAGIKNVVIYKGDYDNQIEWEKHLQVDRAKRVFIAGEADEEAHDARVRLLYEKLNSKILNPKEKIVVNIHDYGLARKLMNTEGRIFESFHDKWASFLWTRIEKSLPLQGVNSVELFIVGFGAMGKAVILTMPKNLPANVEIIVTDNDDKDDEDKLKKELNRYCRQFGKTYNVPELEKWGQALERIGSQIHNGTIRVVVVAKKRSEKGMLLMMDILSQLEVIPRTMCLALNQEIDGSDTDSETAELEIDKKAIILFGMKKGCPDVAC